MDATYSPEDNKLRLYPASRLDAETFERVKAEGFRWAPRQELFVAPAWSPDREDLLIELCGEIGDEDTSLADRATERAERFDGYQERRLAEAEQAKRAVDTLADGIPMGQPILIGHHSQRHAERDAKRIEDGMRKAVNLWKTSKYWTSRAAGVLHHADRKQRPDVVARRIKGLEAERRRSQKAESATRATLALWEALDNPGKDGNPPSEDTRRARALWIANHRGGSYCFTLAEYPRAEPLSQYEGMQSLWSALEDGIITTDQARARAVPGLERLLPRHARWEEHYTLRIGYERALLGLDTAPDEDTPKAKRTGPKLPPILNYDSPDSVPMTRAEWAAKHSDYKGTRTAADGSHRYRVAMVNKVPGSDRWSGLTSCAVFITDSKAHANPAPPAPEPVTPEPEPATLPANLRPYAGGHIPPEHHAVLDTPAAVTFTPAGQAELILC